LGVVVGGVGGGPAPPPPPPPPPNPQSPIPNPQSPGRFFYKFNKEKFLLILFIFYLKYISFYSKK